MILGILPYIGAKHRIARRIATHLRATGADLMVDVFGGSASVLLAGGFKKRVYNDGSGDLVTFFRVIADIDMRKRFLCKLRWTPPSRQLFDEQYLIYKRGGRSFELVSDPVDRAFATFYRHMFAFGGKVRSGGFSVSTARGRDNIKEVQRYRNAIKKVNRIGDFFASTLIENLGYQDAISVYGIRSNAVLFLDPPYLGTEKYYSVNFTTADHVFMAHQVATCEAAVVLTYYDEPILRDLYPADRWEWHSIAATKNSALRRGNKGKTNEVLLVRKGIES